MRSSLARSLKLETRALHGEAERAGLMPELISGRITRGAYCSLLRNLYPIYDALEDALLRHCSHEAIAPVFFPQLFRKQALIADLEDIYGDRWADELEVAPTALTYVERLREVDASHPELLVAHAYVRTLGDLSGGQILKRIVSRSLGLPAGGVRFFHFGAPAQVATMSQAFRAGLDAIRADQDCLDAIVAEAKLSFVLHARLFEELALMPGRDAHPMRSTAGRERPDLAV